MELPLVEPIAVPDTYVSGLARIEDLGGNMRFTFYSLQRPLIVGCHEMERIVVARLVLSRDAVTSAALRAIAATDTGLFLERPH